MAEVKSLCQEVEPRRSRDHLKTALEKAQRITPDRLPASMSMPLSKYQQLFDACKEKVRIKLITGHEAGSDAGSRARKDLVYDGYHEDGWLLFGHGKQHKKFYVIKEHRELVWRNQGWHCLWTDHGSGRSREYAVWAPKLDENEDYKPLGAVCQFRTKGYDPPNLQVGGLRE